jgi:hypothetical protein
MSGSSELPMEFHMMNDNLFWGMGWMHLTGGVIVVLVIAALVKYVFLQR